MGCFAMNSSEQDTRYLFWGGGGGLRQGINKLIEQLEASGEPH